MDFCHSSNQLSVNCLRENNGDDFLPCRLLHRNGQWRQCRLSCSWRRGRLLTRWSVLVKVTSRGWLWSICLPQLLLKRAKKKTKKKEKDNARTFLFHNRLPDWTWTCRWEHHCWDRWEGECILGYSCWCSPCSVSRSVCRIFCLQSEQE